MFIIVLAAFGAVMNLHACQGQEDASGILRSDDPRDPGGLSLYVQECEADLGKIPEINCLEGEVIPIRNSDLGVSEGLGTEITEANHTGAAMKCDKPSLLRDADFLSSLLWKQLELGQCVPNMRVGRGKTQAGFDTDWIYTCRRYYVRGRDDKRFDDINMIGHSPSTGATCFFVSQINRVKPTATQDLGLDGTTIPSLSALAPGNFWKTPDEMTNVSAFAGGSEPCTKCHDSDAWVHSPFIDQVRVDGRPFVPLSDIDKPYYLVSSYFNRPENAAKWKPQHLVSEEASACTSCHRIGSKRTCSDLVRQATGLGGNVYLSEVAGAMHWMPPPAGPGRAHSRAVAAVRFINKCCEDPTAAACVWEDHPGWSHR